MTSAPALAFAGLSARSMAEAGVREGFSAVALDHFGDQDTRRLAQAWQRIGEAAQLRIDPAALLASVDGHAERPRLLLLHGAGLALGRATRERALWPSLAGGLAVAAFGVVTLAPLVGA